VRLIFWFLRDQNKQMLNLSFKRLGCDLNLSKPTVISLFTGAGGLDLGLERAGFQIGLCVEKSEKRVRTLQKNKPSWNPLCLDIRELSAKMILNNTGLCKEEIGLVSAGPPCQPYSKAAYWLKRKSEKICSLQRVSLIKQFVRVVMELKPAGYIMENVPGLTYKPFASLFEEVISLLRKSGYSVNYKILNATEFGVPQKRQRLFIIGARNNIPLSFPNPTHSDVDFTMKKFVSAGDAIGELDDGIVNENERVGGKWGHLLAEIPEGHNYLYLTKKRGHPNPHFKWRSRYWSFLLKLDPEKPSWTIQANPGSYVGPFHWKNRRLRIGEIKRLQTFPDDWELFGSEKEKWKQIANAVPPILAEKLGESVLHQLTSNGLLD
jgi:DNA (cytosine-5)-methyltransferase 1